MKSHFCVSSVALFRKFLSLWRSLGLVNGCFLFVLDDSLRLLFGLGLFRSSMVLENGVVSVILRDLDIKILLNPPLVSVNC